MQQPHPEPTPVSPTPPPPAQSADRPVPVGRSSAASRAGALHLLRAYCLVPNLPADVATSILDLLLAVGFFSEVKGQIDLVGKPGTTVRFPDDAGRVIHQALCSFTRSGPATFLEYCMRGHGASGSGSHGSRWGSTHGYGPPVAHPPGAAQERLDRWLWDRDTLIASFPAKVRTAVSRVVDHVTDELRRDADRARGRPSDMPAQGATDEGVPSAGLAAPAAADRIDTLVTLDQMAAVCSMGKRTLERYLKDGRLPPPTIEGKGGKAHKWRWNEVRPALQKHFRSNLPLKYPGSRFLPE